MASDKEGRLQQNDIINERFLLKKRSILRYLCFSDQIHFKQFIFIYFLTYFSCRPGSLHQRAECVDTSSGQLTYRAFPERQLGGGLQVADNHTSSDGIWQWGLYELRGVLHIYFLWGRANVLIYLISFHLWNSVASAYTQRSRTLRDAHSHYCCSFFFDFVYSPLSYAEWLLTPRSPTELIFFCFSSTVLFVQQSSL